MQVTGAIKTLQVTAHRRRLVEKKSWRGDGAHPAAVTKAHGAVAVARPLLKKRERAHPAQAWIT